MELAGETVQRDVRQTAVSFSDHEVGLLGKDEEDVRRQAAVVIHEVLVQIAVQDILARESAIAELEDRLRVVRIKIRAADVGRHGAAFLTEGSAEHLRQTDELTARVATLEQELEQARQGMNGLDDYLDRLVEQLADPARHLGVEDVTVRLDRMNIVRADGNDATGNAITFQRGRRAGQPGRVLALIRFPRDEIIDDAERMKDLERHLA